jgi:hypothetical protein
MKAIVVRHKRHLHHAFAGAAREIQKNARRRTANSAEGNLTAAKWMRWRTFERLAAEHDRLVTRSLQAAALKFGLLGSDFLF